MLPDRVSNPGPLTYESGALPIALRGPAIFFFFFVFEEKRLSERGAVSCRKNVSSRLGFAIRRLENSPSSKWVSFST